MLLVYTYSIKYPPLCSTKKPEGHQISLRIQKLASELIATEHRLCWNALTVLSATL